ncbi:MAG: Ig-like domain-containing protein [Planctomycetota bacterium]
MGGSPSTGLGDTFCTTFTTAGVHRVSVSLTKNPAGCPSADCGSAIQDVTILDRPASVVINAADPSSMLACQTVGISASGFDGFGNPTDGTYTWTTSNPAVVSVDALGSIAVLHGVSAGSATVTVSFATSGGTATSSIQVDVAPVTLTLSETPPDYLPTDQNDVQYTATLSPAAAASRLRIALVDVTSFPGTHMNFGSDTGTDYYFDAALNPGLTVTADRLQLLTPAAVNSVSVTISSADTGGRARVVAEPLDCILPPAPA